MLTAFSQRELVERARDAGAMAYLVKPFSPSDLVPAIEMAVSRFTELLALEQEVAGLQDRLETRKVVDRAKAVLQGELGLSEPDAFRWIQKTAMDLRLVDARGRRGRRDPRRRPDRILKELRRTTGGPRFGHKWDTTPLVDRKLFQSECPEG